MLRPAVAIVLVSSMALVACQAPPEPPSPLPSHLVTCIEREGIIYTLTIPKNVFALSETLKGTFEVLNTTPAVRTFSFPNIQQFGYHLWHDSVGEALFYPHVVLPAISCLYLQAGQTSTFSISARLVDLNGHPLPPGAYLLRAWLLTFDYSPRASLQITLTQGAAQPAAEPRPRERGG